jgi:F-type H+-transporting ATPase subunit gamma
MRTLAMVNIRRFEQATVSLRAYARAIRLALYVVTEGLPAGHEPLSLPSPAGHGLAVLVGSDQGLCGQFNDRIQSYTRELWSAPDWSVLVVGARLGGMLLGAGANVLATLDTPVGVEAITQQARRLLRVVEEQRAQGNCCRMRVAFSRYVSDARYEETVIDLLPLSTQQFRQLPPGERPFLTLPQLDTEPARLVADLLPQYFLSQLALALGESAASESAARLGAMEGASRNIDQRLNELMDLYRQQRQEEITTELADLLAGVEAVGPGKRARTTRRW